MYFRFRQVGLNFLGDVTMNRQNAANCTPLVRKIFVFRVREGDRDSEEEGDRDGEGDRDREGDVEKRKYIELERTAKLNRNMH